MRRKKNFSRVNSSMCLELDDVILLKCVSFEKPSRTVLKWYFCSHHGFASLSWGSYCNPSWCIHCHWDGSGGSCMSSCVIVFSAFVCACQRVIICKWKILYQFGSPSRHSGFCFPFFRQGWWHLHTKWLLIWKRGWQRDGQKMTCYAGVFWNSWCNQTLCSELSCEWNTVTFQNRIHHLVSFLSTSAVFV